MSVGQMEDLPWLPNLLTVKPGITGPWDVGVEHSLDKEMRLTMYYIRNWTIWLDLQILLQTAQRILRLERGKGAAAGAIEPIAYSVFRTRDIRLSLS